MNIVIPMAGLGRRFTEAGYPLKPFVDVNGKTMIERVIDNLRIIDKDALIHIVTMRNTAEQMPALIEHPGLRLHRLDVPTLGAVDTILRIEERIDNDAPLLIANCDQLVDLEPDEWAYNPRGADGSVMVFPSTNPAHSYIKVDGNGFLCRIVEKRVISRRAVVGLYYFRYGQQFMAAARGIHVRNEWALGEFYVSSVLQEMADSGIPLDTFMMPSSKVHMLGTPEQLRAYLEKS